MSKEKSKKFGEVHTPQHLVDEMLDILPKEVWLDKTKTWLDPATGRNAIFPITVYKRLMKTLSCTIPDPIVRDKHIWENMIYMVELQEDAVQEATELITKTREEFLNEYC